MSQTEDKKNDLTPAYQTMLSRVQTTQQTATHPLSLAEHIQAAKETAVTLEELTREEAERIGTYLYRDLQDAAQFIVENEQELGDWLRFDLEMIEERFLDMFRLMVDHTRLELDNLAEAARQATEWYSGEITGIGTLYCDYCGHALHFHTPDYIPNCPNCGATLFKRR